MNAQDWLGLILTSLSILALVAGSVKWYIQTQTEPMKKEISRVIEAIEDVRAETKTNGGSSMRDEIKFIKKDNEEAKKIRQEQKEKLDHMYDILLDYISKSK